MKILIAGLGSIGRRHLRNLLAAGEDDIVLYRTHRGSLADEDLMEGRSLSSFPVEVDLQKALERKIEAVIVSNPTALHLDVAIPAVEAGCHVLLEKPVSHSLARLDELAVALIHHSVHLLVGYQFRFHPGLQRIKELLDQRVIGQLLSVHAHWGEYLPGWHPWEDYRHSYSAREDLGGGVILTLSHPLDYLRWLISEVDEVWAFTGQAGSLDLQSVEAMAEIGLHFKNGVLGHVHLDYVQQPPSHHLEIIGASGSIRWSSSDGIAQVYQVEEPGMNKTGKWVTYTPPPKYERNAMFLAEMRHFLAVTRRQAEPLCSLQDGRRALELSLAALHSAKSGSKVHV